MLHCLEKLKLSFDGVGKRKEDTFLNSLPYYMLTGRKGLKFYQNGEAGLFICVHPHNKNTILVFPELGGNYDLTVKILNRLSKEKYQVQLARYTETDKSQLHSALERDRLNVIKSIRVKQEDILDWKYPARILDTQLVSEMKGGSFSKLRNKFNKVPHDLKTIPLSDPDSLRAIKSTVLFWLAGITYASKETGHDMTEFYDTLTKQIQDFPSLFDGFVVVTDKEPLGFTIWDYSGGTANALAGLNQRAISGMSEFQTVTACRMLADKGVSRYNLGGSETSDLDNFKLKFRPVDSIQLKTLDVEFDDLDMSDIFSFDVVASKGLQLSGM